MSELADWLDEQFCLRWRAALQKQIDLGAVVELLLETPSIGDHVAAAFLALPIQDRARMAGIEPSETGVALPEPQR